MAALPKQLRTHLWASTWLAETTPTLATDRTCLLMAGPERFAVVMATVVDVSFMPSSLPERKRILSQTLPNDPATEQTNKKKPKQIPARREQRNASFFLNAIKEAIPAALSRGLKGRAPRRICIS